MRFPTSFLSVLLAAMLGVAPAAAQDPAPPPPAALAKPTTLELIEDLRILSILNVLQPTRDQSTRLAAVAATGKDGLAAIDAEVKAALDHQRERLLVAREKVLRGGVTPQFTEAQLAGATQGARATRAQKLEALIVNLTDRVRRILTPEQAARIENELAPTADQPWRQYARVINGPPAPARGAGRLPADPGWWLKELRDLRVDSAQGDPQVEIQDFGKKLTRGLPGNAPIAQDAATQGRAFATAVLAMPPNEFSQREWELARMAAKQELITRNQQRVMDGKPIEAFDPYRWLAEMVMLSPRAATDLRDRAAAR